MSHDEYNVGEAKYWWIGSMSEKSGGRKWPLAALFNMRKLVEPKK